MADDPRCQRWLSRTREPPILLQSPQFHEAQEMAQREAGSKSRGISSICSAWPATLRCVDQVDACSGKDTLLILAEKKGLLGPAAAAPAAAPAPAPAPAAAPTAAAPVSTAAAEGIKQAVKAEAAAALASAAAAPPKPSAAAKPMSRVKQLALEREQAAANQSMAAAASPTASKTMSKVKKMAMAANAMALPGMFGGPRPSKIPSPADAQPAQAEGDNSTCAVTEPLELDHVTLSPTVDALLTT